MKAHSLKLKIGEVYMKRNALKLGFALVSCLFSSQVLTQSAFRPKWECQLWEKFRTNFEELFSITSIFKQRAVYKS